jgi:hypothetical protein
MPCINLIKETIVTKMMHRHPFIFEQTTMMMHRRPSVFSDELKSASLRALAPDLLTHSLSTQAL